MVVEMAISSNASVMIKISPPVDESDREYGKRGGDEQEGYSAGSSATLTRLLPGAAAVCIDQLSYCIPLSLTSTSIFQLAHALELWQTGNALVEEFRCNL